MPKRWEGHGSCTPPSAPNESRGRKKTKPGWGRAPNRVLAVVALRGRLAAGGIGRVTLPARRLTWQQEQPVRQEQPAQRPVQQQEQPAHQQQEQERPPRQEQERPARPEQERPAQQEPERQPEQGPQWFAQPVRLQPALPAACRLPGWYRSTGRRLPVQQLFCWTT